MIYIQLFFEFAFMGIFTVGGALAMVPFLENLGLRTNWFSPETLANMIAVSESTPGPIGINMATYVGNSVGGVLGGIVASLALILPSITIVLIISRILLKFSQNKNVKSVFSALRPASAGLVASACVSIIGISMFSKSATNTNSTILILMALAGFIYLVHNYVLKTRGNKNLAIAISSILSVILLFVMYINNIFSQNNLLPINFIIFIIFIVVYQNFKSIHPIFLIALGGILGAVLKL